MRQCNTCTKKQKYLTKGKCSKCYYQSNKDAISAIKKKYYRRNVEAIKEKNSEYYANNRDAILEQKKRYNTINNNKIIKKKRKYYAANREKLIRQNLEYINKRSTKDSVYRASRNLRSRLYQALKNNHKNGSAVRDLGCSIDHLKKHLEAQFKPGMSWENYGKNGWHIDHIKPLSSFDLTDPEQLKKACHYSNLQPLWWHENLSKGVNNEF